MSNNTVTLAIDEEEMAEHQVMPMSKAVLIKLNFHGRYMNNESKTKEEEKKEPKLPLNA